MFEQCSKEKEKRAMSDERSGAPYSRASFEEKVELLSYLLEKEGLGVSSKLRTIPRANLNDDVPLSFAQERLWFLEQLEPGKSLYNICRVERLSGDLDSGALIKSIAEIVRRHEILRTRFISREDRPGQIVAQDKEPSTTSADGDPWRDTLTGLAAIDLSGVAEDVREIEAFKIVMREARAPFDLVHGPVFRASLLRLSQRDHLLVVGVHQIVYDWRSHELFSKELTQLYCAELAKGSPMLPELPIQYADFAAWQRDSLPQDVFKSQLTFWKTRLSGALPILELPSDHPRPSIQSFQGARRGVDLGRTLTSAVKILSREQEVTSFMTLLAAFQILLYKYSGQDEFIIGFPINGRTHPELQNLIGLFASTLVLRCDTRCDGTFRDLLHRVRAETINAIAHREVPFEKLVDELKLARDLGRNPLFQVMFIFQDTPASGFEPPGLTSEVLEIDCGTSKFDLTLSLVEKKDSITGYVEYSTDLFDHSTIDRMIGHFQTLLEGVVANPDHPIMHLQLITESERHQLLIESNATNADYPKNLCIHELFEAQVERTPEAVAVEFEGKMVTYRELNCRANQLAHHLRDRGIAPEKSVGICFERGLESVVALLGTLKAGGGYVPLDPAYPEQRLTIMLEDSEPAVVFVQQNVGPDALFSRFGTRHLDICLERDWDKIAQQSTSNPVRRARPENLAYIVYTSGSTGRPKAVQVSHRSIVNCLYSIRHKLGFTENDTLLAVTTFSFDIAALELFLPLLNGARVVLANRDEILDGKQLADRVVSSGVTMMQAIPSIWKLLLDAGWRGCEKFKILCGGEVLSRHLADRLLDGGAAVWNLYGPTETTIWSTMAKIEPGEGSVLIGRPIANTRIYILDSDLQPVPVGVHGELYIGGDGLARGYLNQPQLTFERFIPNPFSGDNDERLYRTGDLARYRPDGNIEFLGRIDNQVKIRGYRIELGEIEFVLNQHPTVKESTVIASSFPPPRRGRTKVGAIRSTNMREDAPLFLPSPAEDEGVSESDRNLIAYLVSNTEKPSATELRSFLSQKLPEYMIPSAFVFLDALPLTPTPNGKVDRSNLPPPDNSRPALDQGFVEPRSGIEELVAQVWREVLKLDKIGVFDNFFELGGHSLLATRVVARLCISFKMNIVLRKLFELPTVAALSEHVDYLRRNQSGVSIPTIVPVSRDRSIPLSFAQRRLWFLHKVDSNLTAYNMPSTFRIRGGCSISALERALNEIINRHEILRMRIIESDGEPFQKMISPLTLTVPVIDLSQLPAEQSELEVHRLSAEDTRQPYKLEQAPLMRAKLLKLGEQEHVLMLNFHHIVCDGSSLVIFYRELAALYEAFLNDRDSPLPSFVIQYADYAVWQQSSLAEEVLGSQLAYWKRQLSNIAPLNLPKDSDRPSMQTFRGARLTKLLSEELTKGLKGLSRHEGMTLFMTLLAALNVLLARHTGQEDIVVGSTIAGRNRSELDGLIGFFINVLPLRTDLSGNPTFLELVKQVREVCLDAYTHQDVSFEKVVEELNPQRDLSRNPLFQILFNMADTSERTLTLPGCTVTKLSSSGPSAKFDIVIHAPEINGRIELAMVYNADLFSERRVANLLDQFGHLLSQVADNPQRRIDEYSIVTPSAAVIIPDPAEPLDDTWEGAIHELFTRQAERAPECLAVIDSNYQWTYGELERRSNQVANYLIAQGIQSKDVVAIYAQRSSALVIALLGILKAGAVFVILDPAYPASRLISYLCIARPRAWLNIEGAQEVSRELREHLATLNLCCQLTVTNEKLSLVVDPLKACSDRDSGISIQADDPAYVAFTSGSTGEPKGVLSRHGPMTHFLPWQRDAFDMQATGRFALLSGLAYSHLHRDIFTALYLGAMLYIPDQQIARSPEQLAQWLRDNDITVLHLTPALGQLLVTAGDKTLPSVRRVLFGGDVLTWREVTNIRQLVTHAKIGSFYGATETQRAVAYYEVSEPLAPTEKEAIGPVPLGRGIKNVQLLLLNASYQLAGIGELAELYVRSPHLATGYIGDDDLTGQNFLVNPFTDSPRDRLYRTGELGRYLPDGNVEWAGRNDRRVNIRGFRVELAEVEAVLNQHPVIRESVVVARSENQVRPENLRPKVENQEFNLCLVAYVVAEEKRESLVDLLRSFVGAKLPEYMVPTRFIFLEQLPLNPNGKVDYQTLPAVELSLTGFTDPFAGPRNGLEARLCTIFSQVLGIERVGVKDNFFRFGGHSLLAAQAAARIKEEFGVGVELRTFLELPTVASLARQVESLLNTGKINTELGKDDREEIDI